MTLLTYSRYRTLLGAPVNVLDVMDTMTDGAARIRDWLDGTRAFDHTAAINLATKAAQAFLPPSPPDSNASPLVQQIFLPATPGARVEGTVYVRKGQKLCGAAEGATRLLLKGVVVPATSGTTPFIMGRRAPVSFTGTLNSAGGTSQLRRTITSVSYADTGALVGSKITGAGIPANTTVIGASAGTIVISQDATATGTATLAASPQDPGGLPVVISDLHTFGGDADAPVIDTGGAAGWFVHNIFPTSAGTAIKADGGDGMIYDCIFDQCLTDITVTGQNHQITNCKHYLHSFGIIVLPNTNDLSIRGQHYEYGRTCDINIPASDPSNIRGITIDGMTSTRNVQYGTWLANIIIRSNAARIALRNLDLRNVQGWAILNDTGVDNEITVDTCTIDGRRTVNFSVGADGVRYQQELGGAGTFALGSANVTGCVATGGGSIDLTTVAAALGNGVVVHITGPGIPANTTLTGADNATKVITMNEGATSSGTLAFTIYVGGYAQSTTGRAFYFSNAQAVVKDCVVRNLTAVAAPIVLQNTVALESQLDVEDCRYFDLAPGTPSFVDVLGPTATGIINLADNTGDGVTPLFVPNRFISVKRKNVAWLGSATVEGGRRCIKVPFGPAAESIRFRIAAASNPSDARNVAVKEALIFKRNDTTGGTLNAIVQFAETWISTATTDCPEISLQLDIDTVGTGLTKAIPTPNNGGYFVLSWPTTYTFWSVEAEYL